MQSDEQSKLRHKIETDSQIKNRKLCEGRRVRRLGQKGINQRKSTHKHRQHYGGYQRERGWEEVEEG